jgi:hypothetical protein
MADEVLVDGKAKMHRHGLKDKYSTMYDPSAYWAPPAAVIPASWERVASLMIIPLANKIDEFIEESQSPELVEAERDGLDANDSPIRNLQ